MPAGATIGVGTRGMPAGVTIGAGILGATIGAGMAVQMVSIIGEEIIFTMVMCIMATAGTMGIIGMAGIMAMTMVILRKCTEVEEVVHYLHPQQAEQHPLDVKLAVEAVPVL